MNERLLDNLPHSDEIWRGIGGHFDSLSQILMEFVDNSLANIMASNRVNPCVAVTFEKRANTVFVSVEDTGSGIEDLSNAFRLGGKEAKQGPLNEHGFGMKHALASANPENDSWSICTRTQADLEQGEYQKVEAPYKITDLPAVTVSEAEERWPGEFNGPGTIVRFECSDDMFATLRRGMPGNPGFSRCIDYLVEDLGFVYAGLIQDGRAAITVKWSENGSAQPPKNVAAVLPDWEQYYSPGVGTERHDLGNGTVEIKYAFGAMKESKHIKYYKRNMSSSGLEIRLNGRVLCYNLFREVWDLQPHPMYNHLLVCVDILSDDPDRLPATRTSKNGLRQGDSRLGELLRWVKQMMPVPERRVEYAADELDLFKELKQHKSRHVPDPKTVDTEQYVFTTLDEKVRVDLYMAHAGQVWLYEGKKDATTVEDVYQLVMYWDGAALDGLSPTYGILIAAHHPDSVVRMVEHMNRRTDVVGQPYVFQMKTWRDEGIHYPAVQRP